MDILLIDDHPATRDEVISLIQREQDLKVVGVASNGEEGVRKAQQLQPNLIVMDVIMPGMNGIEATREILRTNRDVHILALSNHTGSSLIQALLEAGAGGYVRKDRAYEELVPAIREVAAGRRYIGVHEDDDRPQSIS